MRTLPSSLLLAILQRVSLVSPDSAPSRLWHLLHFLLAPVCVTVAMLVSLLLPMQVNAQTAPTVDYQFQRALSKIVAGSGSGLVVRQPGTMNIVNAGKVVGSFALNEKRLIDLATLAKYARASTVPTVLALAGTELIKYGLEKCADGSWCKPAVVDPNAPQPYTQANGWWKVQANGVGYGSTADTACRDYLDKLKAAGTISSYTLTGIGSGGQCQGTWFKGSLSGSLTEVAYNQGNATCIPNYTSAGGMCYPPGYVTPQPAPATAADIETAWKGAFQTNPFIQEQYWGFEDQTQNLKAWADALAQTAEVINGMATETRPAVSTTTPKVGGGTETTTKQTTCTYTATANTDAATQKANPVNVAERCVTTTTAPDGTQTQEIAEKAAAPKGGEVAVPPKVDVETCGLPGKPACKIDETGTKTQNDVDQVLTQQSAQLDSRLTVVEQAANDALASVEQRHGSVHILDFFNIFPTFATEQCENPRVPGVGGGDLPVDVCTYYYMLKDVVSFGVALLVIIDSVQVVREAVKV